MSTYAAILVLLQRLILNKHFHRNVTVKVTCAYCTSPNHQKGQEGK